MHFLHYLKEEDIPNISVVHRRALLDAIQKENLPSNNSSNIEETEEFLENIQIGTQDLFEEITFGGERIGGGAFGSGFQTFVSLLRS